MENRTDFNNRITTQGYVEYSVSIIKEVSR